jgi:hypothetical protein
MSFVFNSSRIERHANVLFNAVGEMMNHYDLQWERPAPHHNNIRTLFDMLPMSATCGRQGDKTWILHRGMKCQVDAHCMIFTNPASESVHVCHMRYDQVNMQLCLIDHPYSAPTDEIDRIFPVIFEDAECILTLSIRHVIKKRFHHVTPTHGDESHILSSLIYMLEACDIAPVLTEELDPNLSHQSVITTLSRSLGITMSTSVKQTLDRLFEAASLPTVLRNVFAHLRIRTKSQQCITCGCHLDFPGYADITDLRDSQTFCPNLVLLCDSTPCAIEPVEHFLCFSEYATHFPPSVTYNGTIFELRGILLERDGSGYASCIIANGSIFTSSNYVIDDSPSNRHKGHVALYSQSHMTICPTPAMIHPTPEDTQHVFGLPNQSNQTCYMNSAIQILRHVMQIQRLMPNQTGGAFTRLLMQLWNQYQFRSENLVEVLKIHFNEMYDPQTEWADATECLQNMFNLIVSEQPEATARDRITDTLGTRIKQYYKCVQVPMPCAHRMFGETTTTATSIAHRVPTGGTIDICTIVKDTFKTAVSKKQHKCPCDVYRDVELVLEHRPGDIFGVALKRTSQTVVAINDITYNPISGKVTSGATQNGIKYRCIGAITFYPGKHHYVAYLRGSNGWICANDSYICAVPNPTNDISTYSRLLIYAKVEIHLPRLIPGPALTPIGISTDIRKTLCCGPTHPVEFDSAFFASLTLLSVISSHIESNQMPNAAVIHDFQQTLTTAAGEHPSSPFTFLTLMSNWPENYAIGNNNWIAQATMFMRKAATFKTSDEVTPGDIDHQFIIVNVTDNRPLEQRIAQHELMAASYICEDGSFTSLVYDFKSAPLQIDTSVGARLKGQQAAHFKRPSTAVYHKGSVIPFRFTPKQLQHQTPPSQNTKPNDAKATQAPTTPPRHHSLASHKDASRIVSLRFNIPESKQSAPNFNILGALINCLELISPTAVVAGSSTERGDSINDLAMSMKTNDTNIKSIIDAIASIDPATATPVMQRTRDLVTACKIASPDDASTAYHASWWQFDAMVAASLKMQKIQWDISDTMFVIGTTSRIPASAIKLRCSNTKTAFKAFRLIAVIDNQGAVIARTSYNKWSIYSCTNEPFVVELHKACELRGVAACMYSCTQTQVFADSPDKNKARQIARKNNTNSKPMRKITRPSRYDDQAKLRQQYAEVLEQRRRRQHDAKEMKRVHALAVKCKEGTPTNIAEACGISDRGQRERHQPSVTAIGDKVSRKYVEQMMAPPDPNSSPPEPMSKSETLRLFEYATSMRMRDWHGCGWCGSKFPGSGEWIPVTSAELQATRASADDAHVPKQYEEEVKNLQQHTPQYAERCATYGHIKKLAAMQHTGNEADAAPQLSIQLCPECTKCVTHKRKVPATAIDVGSLPESLPQDLSTAERAFIALCHPYFRWCQIVKWKGASTTYVSGHTICHPHNNIEAWHTNILRGVWPTTTKLSDVIGIHFVGSDGAKSTVRGYLQNNFMPVRPQVVNEWFEELKQRNHLYADIRRDPSSNIQQLYDQFIDESITNGGVSTTNIWARMAHMEKTAESKQDEERSATAIFDQAPSCVFPTNSSPEPHAKEAALSRMIEVRQTEEPVNEYRSRWMTPGAFPELFPHGLYPWRSVPPQWAIRMMMRYHDGRFGASEAFTFQLFDMQRRHRTARYIARLPASKLNKISEMFLNPDFPGQLKAAIAADRKSKEQRWLLRNVNEYVRMASCSGSDPWGQAEAAKAKLYLRNLIKCRGAPVYFLTISPPGSSDAMQFKIMCPRSDPAANEKLQELLSSSFDHRLQAVVGDHGSAAIFFQEFLSMVLHILGVDEARAGPLGIIRDYFVAIETQLKGLLHMHLLIWSDYGPTNITDDIRRGLFESVVAPFWERTLLTSMPGDFWREVAHRKNEDAPIPQASSLAIDNVSSSNMSLEAKWDHLNQVADESIARCQIHRHGWSCRRDALTRVNQDSGVLEYQCAARFSKPAARKTRLVQLDLVTPTSATDTGFRQHIISESDMEILREYPCPHVRCSYAECDALVRNSSVPARPIVIEPRRIPYDNDNDDSQQDESSCQYFGDQSIVECNRTLAACLRCNHQLQILGTTDAAHAMVVYVTKYLASTTIFGFKKRSHAFAEGQASFESIIIDGIKKIVAQGSGEAPAPSTVANRIVNVVSAATEMSMTAVSFTMNGGERFMTKHKSRFLYVWEPFKATSLDIDNGSENDVERSTDNDDDDDDDDTTEQDSADGDVHPDSSDASTESCESHPDSELEFETHGTANEFDDGADTDCFDGAEEATSTRLGTRSQLREYMHRPVEFENTCALIYHMATEHKEFDSDEEAARSSGFAYNVPEGSTLYANCRRIIVRKYFVPLLAGRRTPSLPSDNSHDNRAERIRKHWAMFWRSVVIPWRDHKDWQTASFQSMRDWLNNAMHSQDIVARGLAHYVHRYSGGMAYCQANRFLCALHACQSADWRPKRDAEFELIIQKTDNEIDKAHHAEEHLGEKMSSDDEEEAIDPAMYERFEHILGIREYPPCLPRPDGIKDCILYANKGMRRKIGEIRRAYSTATGDPQIDASERPKSQKNNGDRRLFGDVCPRCDKQRISALHVCDKPPYVLSEKLTREQRQLIDTVSTLAASNPATRNHHLIFLHAHAGCGKTFTATELASLIRSDTLDYHSVAIVSLTGCAACMFDGGSTYHSLFAFYKRSGRGDIPSLAACAEPSRLTDTYVVSRGGIRACRLRLLIVDEISTLPARHLYWISERLKDLTGNNKLPFGGVLVLCVGDFKQTPPVGGMQVHHAALYASPPRSTKRQSEELLGGELWSQAVRYDLSENMRSGICPIHSHRIESVQREGRITREVFTIRDFSEEDALDPAWDDMTTLHPTNIRRIYHAVLALQRHAKRNSQVVYQWLGKMSDNQVLKLSQTEKSQLEALPRVTESFSARARCMLLTNYSVALGLVNGATGVFHSIVYYDRNAYEAALAAVDAAAEINDVMIRLPSRPDLILMEMKKPARDVAKRLQIPRSLARPVNPNHWLIACGAHMKYEAKLSKATTVKTTLFDCTCSYSLTISKSQGQTLGKVVVDVLNAPVTLETSYTAISRPTKDGDIRWVPGNSKYSYKHLAQLSINPLTVQYFKPELWLPVDSLPEGFTQRVFPDKITRVMKRGRQQAEVESETDTQPSASPSLSQQSSHNDDAAETPADAIDADAAQPPSITERASTHCAQFEESIRNIGHHPSRVRISYIASDGSLNSCLAQTIDRTDQNGNVYFTIMSFITKNGGREIRIQDRKTTTLTEWHRERGVNFVEITRMP